MRPHVLALIAALCAEPQATLRSPTADLAPQDEQAAHPSTCAG